MSIFNIPGAEQIPHLLNRTYFRDAEFTKNYKIQRSPYANPLELLPVFEEVLKPLEPHFESSLVPKIRPSI